MVDRWRLQGFGNPRIEDLINTGLSMQEYRVQEWSTGSACDCSRDLYCICQMDQSVDMACEFGRSERRSCGTGK